MIKKSKKFFCLRTKDSGITIDDLKSNKLVDFVLTQDFYRADVGMIIQRKPIFWNYSEKEWKSLEAEQVMLHKSKYNIEFPQSLLKFNHAWFFDK